MNLPLQTWLPRAWRKLVYRWRRTQLDRDLAEELEFPS